MVRTAEALALTPMRTNAAASPPATIGSTNSSGITTLQRSIPDSASPEGSASRRRLSTPRHDVQRAASNHGSCSPTSPRSARCDAPRRAEQPPSTSTRRAGSKTTSGSNPRRCSSSAMTAISLDRVVNRCSSCTPDASRRYPGNFQQYWRLRQERYEQELRAWERSGEYIRSQEEYIAGPLRQLHKQAQIAPEGARPCGAIGTPHEVEVRACTSAT